MIAKHDIDSCFEVWVKPDISDEVKYVDPAGVLDLA
jgi:hypothetical protein